MLAFNTPGTSPLCQDKPDSIFNVRYINILLIRWRFTINQRFYTPGLPCFPLPFSYPPFVLEEFLNSVTEFALDSVHEGKTMTFAIFFHFFPLKKGTLVTECKALL
jgi:hypothetical protein